MKSNINDLKKEILFLYRKVLKSHFKLNKDMRTFGDYFAKTEFMLHYHSKTFYGENTQYNKFVELWNQYLIDINKTSENTKNDLSYEEERYGNIKTLDLDQMKTVNDIKKIIIKS